MDFRFNSIFCQVCRKRFSLIYIYISNGRMHLWWFLLFSFMFFFNFCLSSQYNSLLSISICVYSVQCTFWVLFQYVKNQMVMFCAYLYVLRSENKQESSVNCRLNKDMRNQLCVLEMFLLGVESNSSQDE